MHFFRFFNVICKALYLFVCHVFEKENLTFLTLKYY